MENIFTKEEIKKIIDGGDEHKIATLMRCFTFNDPEIQKIIIEKNEYLWEFYKNSKIEDLEVQKFAIEKGGHQVTDFYLQQKIEDLEVQKFAIEKGEGEALHYFLLCQKVKKELQNKIKEKLLENL